MLKLSAACPCLRRRLISEQQWETDLQKSIDFLLNPFFAFRNDLYVNLYEHMLLCKNKVKTTNNSVDPDQPASGGAV